MIAVIDYGMGNLRSVQKALEKVGAHTIVTSRPSDLKRCDKIVFPGVGAFGDAMRELKRRGLDKAIKDAIADGKPFFGLCLGMQLLFEKSEEAPGIKGLCVLKGEVKRFDFTKYDVRCTKYVLKVPHMGWNCIVRSPLMGRLRTRKSEVGKNKIFNGVADGAYMYFVHSYYARPQDKGIVLTTTDYGIKFASSVCSGNVYGMQFHPEKSQALGLKILKNFVGSR